MASDHAKLSLLAQFDDICRLSLKNTDTADEELLIEFIRNQEDCRKRWHTTVGENVELRKLVTSLTAKNSGLERKLKNTKEVLQKELLRREKCEEKVRMQGRQIQMIRDFLANATELSTATAERLSYIVPTDKGTLQDQHNRPLAFNESVGSVLSPSGDSLDLSDDGGRGVDSPCTSQGKRIYSKYFGRTSPEAKKPKVQDTEASGTSGIHTTVMVTSNKALVATSRVVSQRAIPSASSSAARAPRPARPPSPSPSCAPAAEARPACVPTTLKFTSAPSTPVAQRRGHAALCASIPKRSNSAERPLLRQHCFVTKTLLKTGSICGPCGKRIGFYKTIFKCSRCQAVCHLQCKDQVPLPCTLPSETPKHSRGALISDYAPPTPPMVPALVVHCVQEVERRGLDAVGIYRVPGAERAVREIREKFQSGKGIPNLSKADIYAVCGTLKDFLHSLGETLITKSLWQTFVEAAKQEGDDRVRSTWHAVRQLPRANRDTLAMLLRHLQTVAAHPKAKMPAANLVQVFAPTVVGLSVDKAIPSVSMLGDVEHQNRVMETLLSLPMEYWTQALRV